MKKKKTLAEMQAENRTKDVQSLGAMKISLNNIKDLDLGKYAASGFIVTVTDLSGKVIVDTAINAEDFGFAKIGLRNSMKRTLRTKAEFLKAEMDYINKLLAEVEIGQNESK